MELTFNLKKGVIFRDVAIVAKQFTYHVIDPSSSPCFNYEAYISSKPQADTFLPPACTSLPLSCKAEISQKEIVFRVDITGQNNTHCQVKIVGLG